MPLYLRHGQCLANAEHRLAGQEDDSALTPLGEQQPADAAQDAAKRGLSISRIICSPLKRTHRSAELFAQAYGFTGQIETDPRIIERAMGVVSGMSYDQAPTGDWSDLQGVEPFQAVQARVLDFWREHRNEDGLLVVGRDAAQKVLEATRRGLALADSPSLPSFPQDRVIEIDLTWL
jgi:broad specificity phosphatase PhoE